ncbi:Nn.00g048790.m01.CDS01 [Neocucurbitaria sp. VM-36]
MSSTTSAKGTVIPIVLDADTIGKAPAETFSAPNMGGNVSWKTLISSPSTPSDTFTVGIATCPPRSSAPCPATFSTLRCPFTTSADDRNASAGGHLKLHRHAQAELYHVTSGRGIMSVDGVEHEVRKGSVVFIPGHAEHGIRNLGGEELCWLYVFAAKGFEEVVYQFSEVETKAKL